MIQRCHEDNSLTLTLSHESYAPSAAPYQDPFSSPPDFSEVMGSAPPADGDSYQGEFDDDYEQLIILFPQIQPAKIEAMLKLLKSKELALDKVRNNP